MRKIEKTSAKNGLGLSKDFGIFMYRVMVIYELLLCLFFTRLYEIALRKNGFGSEYTEFGIFGACFLH